MKGGRSPGKGGEDWNTVTPPHKANSRVVFGTIRDGHQRAPSLSQGSQP